VRRYTRDPELIRAWIDERGGEPARVRGTDVPRIAFGPLAPNWEPLGWADFLDYFESGRLAFMYEDTAGSKVFKIVKGHTVSD
jgi:hypothetical protein